jgi:aspartyl aminopeptidase
MQSCDVMWAECCDPQVCVRRPIMRIPTLAIHLDRGVNQDGFKPNFETHLAPVLATQVKAALSAPKKKDDQQVKHTAGSRHRLRSAFEGGRE